MDFKSPSHPTWRRAFGTKHNPIVHHVRAAFRRNRADTSPRLVYPALQAGYRMLALLSRASAADTIATQEQQQQQSSASSPEQAAVEAFLRARRSERDATLAAKALHPPNSRNPRPPTSAPAKARAPPRPNLAPADARKPLPGPGIRRSEPTPAPIRTRATRRETRKEADPAPRDGGRLPFLRLTKPQPALLSRVLHKKNKKRVERISAWTQFKEEDMLDAQEEDEWERELARLGLAEEKEQKKKQPSTPRGRQQMTQAKHVVSSIEGDAETYEATIREHGLQYLSDILNQEREDSVARADAMRDLIKAETALRQQEEKERRLERRRTWEGKLQLQQQQPRILGAHSRLRQSLSDHI
ncbi:hypothetical protein PG997_005475 [Apiospora hydei]|uniref:Uncharacterized protein n=1 Tax=Apiospora hydei TaxID=1337664 RepID=A0ABR1WKZ2_9PEZI